MNSGEVWLTSFQFPLIGHEEIYSLIISLASILDNYIGYVVSHSLIKGHLGVENSHFRHESKYLSIRGTRGQCGYRGINGISLACR